MDLIPVNYNNVHKNLLINLSNNISIIAFIYNFYIKSLNIKIYIYANVSLEHVTTVLPQSIGSEHLPICNQFTNTVGLPFSKTPL